MASLGATNPPPQKKQGGVAQFRSAAAPLDETVTAIAGAASAATEHVTEVTGHAARSLFNFAAKSLKTVVSTVNNLTGQLQVVLSGFLTWMLIFCQVGNHKVVVVRELAQGGFGNVLLVRDVVHPSALYAMKQMICQSQEQVAV